MQEEWGSNDSAILFSHIIALKSMFLYSSNLIEKMWKILLMCSLNIWESSHYIDKSPFGGLEASHLDESCQVNSKNSVQELDTSSAFTLCVSVSLLTPSTLLRFFSAVKQGKYDLFCYLSYF